jgi:hypothetical protein
MRLTFRNAVVILCNAFYMFASSSSFSHPHTHIHIYAYTHRTQTHMPAYTTGIESSKATIRHVQMMAENEIPAPVQTAIFDVILSALQALAAERGAQDVLMEVCL